MEETDRVPTRGSSPQTASEGYQSGSTEPAPDSPGYQFASERAASSEQAPQSLPSDEDDERTDPKKERQPGIWLAGEDELDRDGGKVADSETRFSRDAWGGRGNPQVSVRLRPRDFERLRRAADLYGVRPTTFARMMVIRGVGAVLEAELRRKGEFLREP